MLRWVTAFAALLTFSRTGAAQDLHGVVRDSATRLPIRGAVVTLLDVGGTALERRITNERGQYRLAAPRATRRMRVVRMGFRPRELAVALTTSGDAAFDVAMVSVPTMLEPVRAVTGASCPRRTDRLAALALLEQARAGLLNAIVARSAHPASMTILPFERTMDGATERIERQSVRTKSSDRVTTSFSAVRSASEFVRKGFAQDSADTGIYYGPDADVLLDEGFTAGYCFHLRGPPPNRARPNQVGLAFGPASRHRGRIDLDGTLWIDTVARKLRDMEYRYLGLPAVTDPVRPGGQATFWEMPNGIVFIDKWHLRLPVPQYDTSYNQKNERIVRVWHAARETGGEVATARWPEGHAYQGPLGILNSRAVDSEGKPVTGIVVRLVDTDYVASPDSLGFFEIFNLLPGPYTAVVIHPAVAKYGITLPTAMRFVAVRDSVVQQGMLVPDPWQYVRKACTTNPLTYEEDPLFVLKLETPDGKPVTDAHWQLSVDNGVPWQRVTESRMTDPDGRVRQCLRLRSGDVVEIRVWREDETPKIYLQTLGRRRSHFNIVI